MIMTEAQIVRKYNDKTIIQHETKRRIERAYLKLDEVMTELDAITDEIIDRAYDETRAPKEDTQEYRDAMNMVNAICDAMTQINEAENFLSDAI